MKGMPKPLMFTMAFAVTLGLLQFWPFTLIFLILGGIVSVIISGVVGQDVNYFFILFIEYLLMALAIVLALYMQGRFKK